MIFNGKQLTAFGYFEGSPAVVQITPEFVNSIEECTDTSKVYVLPDGYIYAYMLTTGDAYTNQIKNAIDTDRTPYNGGKGHKTGWRFNSSNEEMEEENSLITGYIPYTSGQVIRISGYITSDMPYGYFQTCKSDFSVYSGTQVQQNWGTEEGFSYGEDPTAQGIYVLTIDPAKVENKYLRDTLYDSNTAYIRVNISGYNESALKVTLDEEIAVTTDYKWTNTGHAFVPADYEDRIIKVETDIATLKEAISGDMAVYGIVDSDNNIIMTGTLESGTYTLKYMAEDGTTTDIGTFTME